MPKYQVNYRAYIGYEVWARDRDHAMETFLDGKLIYDDASDFEVIELEEEECNTCGDSGRWETTLEDSPTTLIDLGPCPESDCPTNKEKK